MYLTFRHLLTRVVFLFLLLYTIFFSEKKTRSLGWDEIEHNKKCLKKGINPITVNNKVIFFVRLRSHLRWFLDLILGWRVDWDLVYGNIVMRYFKEDTGNWYYFDEKSIYLQEKKKSDSFILIFSIHLKCEQKFFNGWYRFHKTLWSE